MKRTIQTRVDANGDVHLDFSGFTGRDCQTEEDRLRRELAELGLNVDVRISSKSSETGADVGQRASSSGLNV